MFTGAHRRGHLSTKFLCSGVVTSGVILDKLSCENYAVSDVVTCAYNECETYIETNVSMAVSQDNHLSCPNV